jgi:hypothetical protein
MRRHPLKRLALAAILVAGLPLAFTSHASAAEVPDASCQPTPDAGVTRAKVAQTFTALHTGQVTSATMQISKPASTTEDYLIEVRTVDMSGVPTETGLGSAAVPASGLPDDVFAYFTANFSTPASVVAGQPYALVLSRPGTNVIAGAKDADPCAGAGYSASVITDPFSVLCPTTCWDLVFAVFVTPQPVQKPTNGFSFGELKRNKKKGTATLNLTLPNPGELTASGDGVRAASAGRAVISKSVTAGPAQLLIKAKGKKKKTLNETGKVKLNVVVTYTPTGGDPSTQSTRVKLKKL